ncbi:hypothetical protein CALCODRAFT_361011 [Calocera cornea HHB12733]|uniref:Uncharacterized protein n=1 Tax=Calocera cornea HHB12733 TaxID=1353952 RepID=A0A165EKQ8_9BASI|nr:hypothetical protein CALCODRAFT_361011 [Calocera cornea HHB12733]
MSDLSEQELIQHFSAMKAGRLDSAFELTPWQDTYITGSGHDEGDTVDELITYLCRTLNAVKLVVATPTTPSTSSRSITLAHLRTIHALSADFVQMRHCYDVSLHKLRCQAFLSNAPVAKVTRLPDDILAMVFEAASDPLRKSSEYDSFICGGESRRYRKRPTQITIAAVCSKWRNIAHNTPALWDTIILSSGLEKEASDEWCKRGKSVPMHLGAVVSSCTDEDRPYQTVFINSVSHRLRSLKLHGHKLTLYDLALEWIMPAPRLRALEIVYDTCYCRDLTVPPQANGTFIRAPSSLPALRNLTITPLSFPWRTAPAFDGCLSPSLQYLSLAFQEHQPLPDLRSTLRLLAGVPNLNHLRMRSVRFCMDAQAECTTVLGLDPVRLPCLRYLYVTTCQGGDRCFAWLQLLDAPILRTVNINNSQVWQRVLRLNGN